MTGVAAAIALGGAVLVADHAWMVKQRDLLKDSASAGAMAAVLALRDISAGADENAVRNRIRSAAQRYVEMNLLGNLPPVDQAAVQADGGVAVDVAFDPALGTVDVAADAPGLGRPLLACHIPFIANAADDEWRLCDPDRRLRQAAGAQRTMRVTEVVLALDVSISMGLCMDGRIPECPDDQRIDSVREASRDLLDMLAPDPTAPGTAVGLVPWAWTVRLDAAARDQWVREGWAVFPDAKTYPMPWGAAAGDAPEPAVRLMPPAPPEPWLGCLDRRDAFGAAPPATTPAVPDTFPAPMGFYSTMRGTTPLTGADQPCRPTADWSSGDGRQVCYDGRSSFTPWRSERLDSQSGCTRIPPMVPLTTDGAALRAALDALRPSPHDGTHSAMGLAWAHRMLDSDWRFVWGDPEHPLRRDDPRFANARRAIVLLSGGQDAWEGVGRLRPWLRDEVCTRIKAAGIRIYVVGVTGRHAAGGGLEESLRRCSSEDDHPGHTYAFLQNADRATLEEAFRAIGDQLLAIRRTY